MSRLIILLLIVSLGLWIIFLRSGPPSATELRAMHHEAVALIEQHRFVDAEKVLLRVVEHAPEEFAPRFNLAIAQLNQAEKGVGRALDTLAIADTLLPNQARVWYSRGVIHEYVGNSAAALVAFRRAAELAPLDANANYRVAIAIQNSGDPDAAAQALPYFEIAARLDPAHLGAWNNLRGIYFSLGRIADGEAAVARMQALNASGEGLALSEKYTEQGGLARSMRDWNAHGSPDESPMILAFDPPLPLGEAAPSIEDRPAALVDLDLDCLPDLWVAGDGGGIWVTAEATPTRHPLPAALEGATAFAIGDLDEDGVADLVTAIDGTIAVHSVAGVPVPRLTPKQTFPIPDLGEVRSLQLVDLDLEGDLDLVIIPARGTPAIALNEGRQLRAPDEPRFPLAIDGSARLVAARSIDADVDADLVLATTEAPYLRLVRNDPEWNFSIDPEGWAPSAATATSARVWIDDFDGDAIDDLLIAGEAGGANALRLATGDGRAFGDLAPLPAFTDPSVPAPGAITDLVATDFDLDGDLDLALAASGGGDGSAVWIVQNDGRGGFTAVGKIAVGAISLLAGDADGDFDPDLIALTATGPVLVRNATDPAQQTGMHHVLRTYFGGERDGDDRRTNLLGYGVRVEVRSGDLLVGRLFEGARGHRAQGLAPLIAGIGPRTEIEWTYLVWPDGVSQAEIGLVPDACGVIREVQRKSSSCPVLFTWDGRGYRFITDFMGGGGLGFWIGPGEYAPPEPTEVVRIAPDALLPIEGELRLSVMEPMQESCSVDRLALAAVDHPAATEVYPQEYLAVGGEPATGAPLLVEDSARLFPVALSDAGGVLDPALLAAVDRRYAGPRMLDPDLAGYAEAQEWILTFDRSGEDRAPTHLFLDGWVEYPYSRLNFAAWQRPEEGNPSLVGGGPRRLEAPSFWWDRGDGAWQILGKEIGYPAGMPKTMVLDVRAAIAAGATRLKIATNLELFWDRIFLAPALELEAERSVSIPLLRAVHRFGGYPREYSDDGALPPTYHYDERDPTLGFQAMGGQFTKYGRVDELLATVDDRFVVMGGGDELILAWDATALPELRSGAVRTYLLDTHGYCKDRDPLTAEPASVEPLPFAAMSTYPPAERDVEPERSEYRRAWNTRRDGAEMPSWPRLIDDGELGD